MSTFEVLVRQVDDVFDHPHADRLSIVKILGYEAIVAKDSVQKGEAIVYVPEAAIIPEEVLRQYNFWNEEKGIGMLAGKKGDRVKIVTLRKRNSQGLIFKLDNGHVRLGSMRRPVAVGDDVAAFFGITKYSPPIPQQMDGEVVGIPEMSFNFDIENWQNFPGFLDNDEVEAVEKCHGTNFRICYHPNVSHPDLFGERKNVGIASKSLGAEGKMFKNNRLNLGSLYTPTSHELADDRRAARRYKLSKVWGIRWALRKLKVKVPKPINYNKGNLYVKAAFDADLIRRVTELGQRLGKRIDLFGEVYGAGVQNLHYGKDKPVFSAFDIAIDGKMQDVDAKDAYFKEINVPRLPVLYRGPWNEDILIKHRDGKTLISGDHIREGIVVTAVGDQSKRDTPDGRFRLRPILKMVSPAYLNKYDDGTATQ